MVWIFNLQDKAWAFERVVGMDLKGHEDRMVSNVPSRRDCEELCLREKAFKCRSAVYNTVSLDCALSRQGHCSKQLIFLQPRSGQSKVTVGHQFTVSFLVIVVVQTIVSLVIVALLVMHFGLSGCNRTFFGNCKNFLFFSRLVRYRETRRTRPNSYTSGRNVEYLENQCITSGEFLFQDN